jgi:hypothetical protein
MIADFWKIGPVFPPPRHPGYNRGMSDEFGIAAELAFGALCIWLAVRIVNRREKWAITIAAGLLIPILLGTLGGIIMRVLRIVSRQ